MTLAFVKFYSKPSNCDTTGQGVNSLKYSKEDPSTCGKPSATTSLHSIKLLINAGSSMLVRYSTLSFVPKHHRQKIPYYCPEEGSRNPIFGRATATPGRFYT